MERDEHLEWAKQRAREYLAAGDAVEAVVSMVSDLRKHEHWADFAAMPFLAMAALQDGTVEAARRFVEGFN